jgi:hypothetical protein
MYMRTGVMCLCAALLATTTVQGQTQQESRARITAVIERGLQSNQRVRLAADRITLTGVVLRLIGKVRITLGTDTLIQADEATLDRGAHTVELVGNVRASLGPSVLPPFPRPRIDYR